MNDSTHEFTPVQPPELIAAEAPADDGLLSEEDRQRWQHYVDKEGPAAKDADPTDVDEYTSTIPDGAPRDERPFKSFREYARHKVAQDEASRSRDVTPVEKNPVDEAGEILSAVTDGTATHDQLARLRQLAGRVRQASTPKHTDGKYVVTTEYSYVDPEVGEKLDVPVDLGSKLRDFQKVDRTGDAVGQTVAENATGSVEADKEIEIKEKGNSQASEPSAPTTAEQKTTDKDVDFRTMELPGLIKMGYSVGMAMTIKDLAEKEGVTNPAELRAYFARPQDNIKKYVERVFSDPAKRPAPSKKVQRRINRITVKSDETEIKTNQLQLILGGQADEETKRVYEAKHAQDRPSKMERARRLGRWVVRGLQLSGPDAAYLQLQRQREIEQTETEEETKKAA